MVTTLMFIAAAIWIVGGLFFVIHVKIAPLGVEDENGFRVINLEPARVVESHPRVSIRRDVA